MIVYGDYECPFCAAVEARLSGLQVRIAFRHFPVRSSHPRAQAAACAAEAAALQDAFWPFHDSLFADQGRLEDPHLWQRAERLGLDLARFDADRRSDAVADLVARRLPRRASARAWPRPPRCSSTGRPTPGVPAPRCGRHWAHECDRAEPPPLRPRIATRPWPPVTHS